MTLETASWKLVPIQATDEMCEAAWESDGTDYVGEYKRIYSASVAYEAMIAAAPEGFKPILIRALEEAIEWCESIKESWNNDMNAPACFSADLRIKQYREALARFGITETLMDKRRKVEVAQPRVSLYDIKFTNIEPTIKGAIKSVADAEQFTAQVTVSKIEPKHMCPLCGGKFDNDLLSDICKACEARLAEEGSP